MWIEYNPNPVGRSVGDCAVRAISKALDVSWETAYLMLLSNVKLKQALERKSVDEIILLIDELLEALEVLNPRLYRSFINKL